MLAVKYMHEVGIMHQDLKAENVFCTEGGMVKVLDFGLAAPKTENKTKFIGTIYYLAPEVIKGMYDERRDVWSIGVLFHMLLLGDLPFRGDSFDRVKQRIETQEVTIPRKSHLSSEAEDLLLKLLTKNPYLRISLEDALAHPFFKKHEDHLQKTAVEEKTEQPRGPIEHGDT